MKTFKILIVANFLISFQVAQAYPEMVRNGYVNCNTCHVSLTGAGILNDYGREIGREKLALFKSDNEKSREPLFAYGAFTDAPIAKYLKGGGDVRSVYYIVNDSSHKEARTIFMQGDLEGAFVKGRWTIDATAGIEQPIPGKNVSFLSRRHYAQYAISDEFNVRVGKFVPAFGIKNPEHVFLTRDALGFSDNFESYNLEVSYISDQFNVFVTGMMGRFDSLQASEDRGGTAQVSFAPTERMKVGVNAWYGQQEDGQNRWVLGGFGMLGLTSKLYASSDIDVQLLQDAGSLSRTKGFASTQKISYELTDGLWAALIQEYGKIDFLTVDTQAENYGLEIQIFPRSHFEFNLAYERVRGGGGTQNFSDYYWLVSHFYL